MPKHHRGLTQPPAQIDLSPVHETAKVAQADLVALEFDSQVLELVDIALKSFPLELELVLCVSEFFEVGIVAGTTALSRYARNPLLQVVNQARLANDILNNCLDQRQGPVGLLDAEVLVLSLGKRSRWGHVVVLWMKWMDGEESIIARMNGVSSREAAGTACAQVDPALITGKQHSSRKHAASCPRARPPPPPPP